VSYRLRRYLSQISFRALDVCWLFTSTSYRSFLDTWRLNTCEGVFFDIDYTWRPLSQAQFRWRKVRSRLRHVDINLDLDLRLTHIAAVVGYATPLGRREVRRYASKAFRVLLEGSSDKVRMKSKLMSPRWRKYSLLSRISCLNSTSEN